MTQQNMYAMRQHGDVDSEILSAPRKKRKTAAPIVIENDVVVSLYFDARGVQSSMLIADPYALALGYTRTMVGFFLFQPAPRRISMIGLGGGSLAKYCHRHSPDARLAVVEINRDVINLRDRFHVPPDSERLEVVCANGANYVKGSGHRPDVILVDGFTADGLSPELASTAFSNSCSTFGSGSADDRWSTCPVLSSITRAVTAKVSPQCPITAIRLYGRSGIRAIREIAPVWIADRPLFCPGSDNLRIIGNL